MSVQKLILATYFTYLYFVRNRIEIVTFLCKYHKLITRHTYIHTHDTNALGYYGKIKFIVHKI